VTTDITGLVQAAGNGDRGALQDLFATVYGEIKRLAHNQLAHNAQPTLNTTGLVHEAYLKLIQPDALQLRDRGHFFAIAAKAMRQIIIDHARRRQADKRGGPALQAVTLDENSVADSFDPETLTQLDSALSQLQQLEPRLAELVEMRFFAGLSVVQVAELREVAPRTVLRDWRRARAYLFDSVRNAQA
jgi:RNA polymerase sigma factor (TIGR02999 family)